jgi:hypothetical protein
MTDEDALAIYNLMVEYFGDDLPDPEHEPIRFAHFYKVFKYYNSMEQHEPT